MSAATIIQGSPPFLFGIVVLAILSALPAPFLVSQLKVGGFGNAVAVLGALLLIACLIGISGMIFAWWKTPAHMELLPRASVLALLTLIPALLFCLFALYRGSTIAADGVSRYFVIGSLFWGICTGAPAAAVFFLLSIFAGGKP